ncbi:MAG TPA: TetR/AcrR family transcriptional regulator [Symbiobacteriaceae bacterium]|nr:TetR/AcrR family transcriptional regulator [Symbiobacteriaceae bacterium]
MGRPTRKDLILEVAVRLFSERGFHGTTIREIAEAAGMLSGSLYAHIQTKEDLLYEVVMQAADRFLGAIEPLVVADLPAAEKLRQAMIAHVEVVAASRAHATVFMHEWKALTPERRAEVAARRKAYEQQLGQILTEGVRRGEFKPLDERMARLLILSAVNWLYEWYDPTGPLSPSDVAERYWRLVLEGLQPRT